MVGGDTSDYLAAATFISN